MSCDDTVDMNNETGMGHALLGLIGMGDLYDPMGILRGELSIKVAEFNNTTAQYALLASMSTSNVLKEFLKNNMSLRDLTSRQLNDLATDTNDLFESENQSIKFLYLFTLVIAIYLIIGT